jgi:hypothetical protein
MTLKLTQENVNTKKVLSRYNEVSWNIALLKKVSNED